MFHLGITVKIIKVLVITILPIQVLFAQIYNVSGVIQDSVTGEKLSAASIRIFKSPVGTITNSNGNYRLSLANGKYIFLYSYLGYRSDTMQIILDHNIVTNIKLVPSDIQLADVYVIGEDPAVGIMRKVIANKKHWMDTLNTYQCEAFTRDVIRRDTAIAMIDEAYTTGYWQKGDTLREIVRQQRQTQNLKGLENFAAIGEIINFYDDDVRFNGFTFVGPTSKEAFNYYDFKLERTRKIQSADVFEIRITPRSRLVPLFKGIISIVDGQFSLAGVEVSPNEAFELPLIGNINLTYKQQFAIFNSTFWMPIDISVKGTFEISFAGITIPKIGIESYSSIYDYKINIALPDSILKKPKRYLPPEAEKMDSTFWAEHEILPLTSEEQVAYHTLDSTQTINKQFQATGFLVTVSKLFHSPLKYLDYRFDRIEGSLLGVKTEFDSLTNSFKLRASLGYGFSDRVTKGWIAPEYFLTQDRKYGIGVEVYKKLAHFPDESYDDFSVTISSLLFKNDPRDYYYAGGWKMFFDFEPIEYFEAKVGVQSEENKSAIQNSYYSLFYRNDYYRTSPTIPEGMFRSLTAKFHYGDNAVPLNLVANNYAELNLESSNPSIIPSLREFSQVIFKGQWLVRTFMSRSFLAPTLSMKILAGMSSGDLPIQRVHVLESQLDGFDASGTLRGLQQREFGGDEYAVLSLEHNFRSLPFLLLNIPYLYKRSIEIILHVGTARSWANQNSTRLYIQQTPGWYSEMGIGISRILGLLRIDITRRFTPPSRLVLTFGIATIL